MHVGGCRQRPALGRFSPLSRAASVMLSEDCPSKARSTPRPRASESMKLGSAAWLSSAMGIDLLRLNEYWRFYPIIGQIGIIMAKRSEERSVGKELVSRFRSRWWPE